MAEALLVVLLTFAAFGAGAAVIAVAVDALLDTHTARS
jgi:hypothetical protein